MILRFLATILLAGTISAVTGIGLWFLFSLLPCPVAQNLCNIGNAISFTLLTWLVPALMIIFGLTALARNQKALDVVASLLGVLVIGFLAYSRFKVGFSSTTYALQSFLQFPLPVLVMIAVQWYVFRARTIPRASV